MKIRIFALAKELDIDSKLLIDYCAKAGITIKNSALASISPEERDRVMDIIRSNTPGSSPAVSSVAAATAAPVTTREPAVDLAAKARPIKVLGSKPPLMVPRSRPSEPEVVRHVVEPPAPIKSVVVAPVVEPTPAPVEVEVVAPAPLETPVPAPAAVSIAAPQVGATDHLAVAEADSTSPIKGSAIVKESPVSNEEKQTQKGSLPEQKSPTETKHSTGPTGGSAPLTPKTRDHRDVPSGRDAGSDRGGPAVLPAPRQDLAASPVPQKSMRVMVSRGTAELGGAKGGASASSKKAKAAGPLIAEIPRFKAPPSNKAPKPEEAAPQKPVQRFTADAPTKEAPLGQILRKRPDASVKKKVGDEESEEVKAKRTFGGASLQETRNQRRKVSLKDIDEEGRGQR